MSRREQILMRERLFSSKVARISCEKVYGSSISQGAWSNWRSWAGVSRHNRLVRFDEFCLLIAIAHTRKSNQYGELFRGDIEDLANSLLVQEAVAAAIREMDFRGAIEGRNVEKALRKQGIHVSRATLYRKIPGFSMDNLYSIWYLEAMCG